MRHEVPDTTDRIYWRGAFYGLREQETPLRLEEPNSARLDERQQRQRAALSKFDDEGMIVAFEVHHGQSWLDKDWRKETVTWAAAWRAAKAADR